MGSSSRRAAALALVVAGAATAAMPAGADEAAPLPTSCAGMSFTDPAGDQKVNMVPLSGGIADQIPKPQKAKDNVDIIGGFLRYVTEGDKNVLTANLVVTDLTAGSETGASGLMYTFGWTQDGATRFVQATVPNSGDPAFTYGTNSTSGYDTEGETTGKLHMGKNGVVSIVIPVQAMGMANKSLTLTNASAANLYEAEGRGFFPENDAGPDNRQGKAFKVAPCAEAGTPTQAGPTVPQVPVAVPDTGTPAPTGVSTLNLKVIASKLSARKLKRARSVSVKLSSGEAITGLTASLRKGSRTLAKGSLASLSGTGTMKLKLARKAKLRKGTYSLVLKGTNAAGQAASAVVSLRVAK